MTEVEKFFEIENPNDNDKYDLSKVSSWYYGKKEMILFAQSYADEQVNKALENQSNVWRESHKQIAIDTEKYVIAIVEKSLMSDGYIKFHYDEDTLDNDFIRGIRYQRDKTQEAINKLKKS